MDINLVALIVGIAGPVAGIVIAVLGLRKARAEVEQMRAQTRKLDEETALNKIEKADTFAEATAKFLDNQVKLQERNRELYNQNVELEKRVTDGERIKQTLGDRLTDREATINSQTQQIDALNKHLQTLQDKQKQSEITNALVSQQQAIIQIAQSYQQIIEEREKTMAAREQVFREIAARTGPLGENKKGG